MTSCNSSGFANITYRAMCAGGQEVEIHLTIDPSAASIADAWSRLTGAYAAVDPMTLEIEIRRVEPVAESALAAHGSFDLARPADLHLVALALPDPDQPGAGLEPRRPGCSGAFQLRRTALPRGRLERRKPPLERLSEAAMDLGLPLPGDAQHHEPPPCALWRRRIPGLGPRLLRLADRRARLTSGIRCSRDRRGRAVTARPAGVVHPAHRSACRDQVVGFPRPYGCEAHVVAALAKPGDGGAGGVRQPARRCRQVLERRPIGTRDRLEQHRELAARCRFPATNPLWIGVRFDLTLERAPHSVAG